MTIYKVTLKPIVDFKDLDFDDRHDLFGNDATTFGPIETYIEAEDPEHCLDEFHQQVAIACLDHFEILVTN